MMAEDCIDVGQRLGDVHGPGRARARALRIRDILLRSLPITMSVKALNGRQAR